MSVNLIGPKKFPYASTWKLAQEQLSMVPSSRVDVPLLVAVCVRASNCDPFICRMDSLYSRVLREVCSQGDVLAVEFLKEAMVWNGSWRGKVGKYRYHSRCFARAEEVAAAEGGGHLRAVVYSCTWGIAQQPGFEIVSHVDVHMRKEYFSQYLGDNAMQMRQLIQRLDRLLFIARGGVRTALLEFYNYLDPWVAAECVDRCIGLAAHYRAGPSEYYAEGSPLRP